MSPETAPTETRRHLISLTYPVKGPDPWVTNLRYVAQIPAVGEHFALSTESAWYRVEIVVHCAFDAPVVAEVYGVEAADQDDEQLRKMRLAAGMSP